MFLTLRVASSHVYDNAWASWSKLRSSPELCSEKQGPDSSDPEKIKREPQNVGVFLVVLLPRGNNRLFSRFLLSLFKLADSAKYFLQRVDLFEKNKAFCLFLRR